MAIGMPIAPIVGLIGIFWHPYDLPTGLNALALAGTSFGVGLIGFMVSQALGALATSAAASPTGPHASDLHAEDH